MSSHVQLRWDTWNEMCDHAGVGKLEDGKPQGRMDGLNIGLDIPTEEGLLQAWENDYIVRSGNELLVFEPGLFVTTELIREVT